VKILLLCQYYSPEEQNIFVHECASGLVGKGHDVIVLTAFPHYGRTSVYEGYRGKVFQRETIDGVKVMRAWVYATGKKGFYPRLANFGSFCGTSLIAGVITSLKPDVVYTWIPPLPLGVTGALLAGYKRVPYVVHVQDIYPRVAVEHGMLTNPKAIRFFESMEKWVYKKANKIIVISEGFKADLASKGVSENKLSVVENWADPNFIKPGPKDNSFRRELNVNGRFLAVYSGGLNHNADLTSVIQAADILRDDPFFLVIVGEGQYKERLMRQAEQLSLTNVKFLPFQPFERYPEVLNAADINLVPLSTRSAVASVPSKIYKQMAAGRAILAITPSENELFRLVDAAKCGMCVPPDDAEVVANALRSAAAQPDRLLEMGRNARSYLEQHHNLQRSVDRVAEALESVQ
jgi:colanic acid biosynthesis glycosyl transferase WcaI